MSGHEIKNTLNSIRMYLMLHPDEKLTILIDRLCDLLGYATTSGTCGTSDVAGAIDNKANGAVNRLDSKTSTLIGTVTYSKRKASDIVIQIVNLHTMYNALVQLDIADVYLQSSFYDVLYNIINNAFKYSQRVTKPQINISIDRSMISVTDNGGGMPNADLKCIGLPYYRHPDTSSVSGDGLGMYMVAKYCTAHGYRLVIKNKPKKYFRVIIYLE